MEFAGLGDDLHEPVGETREPVAGTAVRQAAAEHLEDMLGGKQGISDGLDAGTSNERSLRGRSYVARLRSRQLKLALEILLGDFDVLHGHVGALMTQEFHHSSEADASPQHLSSIGMPELVRDDASRNSDGPDNLA